MNQTHLFEEPREEWNPKYSKQGMKERNCGQHCIAMITHIPVEIICSEINRRKGTYTRELPQFLRWFGYDCENYEEGWKVCDLAILYVQHHWCLYWRGMIWDSCGGIWKASEDKRRIKGFIKVEVPKI